MGFDDVSEYCRAVEDHLTRVNGGHLVRIVGPGFELVRGWAEQGIPLSVVFRGIELKADRHRTGRARRPLRIEFCEGDVRDLYEGWRRAVGLPRATGSASEPAVLDADEHDEQPTRKRPSLAKHIDRAIDRLGRVAGRLDLPEPFHREVGEVLQELATLRDAKKGARGESRDQASEELKRCDGRLTAAARAVTTADELRALEQDAARDLAAFRDRLAGDAWSRAIEATVDRLLRDRFGLPTVEV